MATQSGEQLPVADLIEPQVALGGRLSAADGEDVPLGAESNIVDGAENVGQYFRWFSFREVPDDHLTIAADCEQVVVGAERDGGDRRKRADLQGEIELASPL